MPESLISDATRATAGVLLVTIVAVESGGLFLLRVVGRRVPATSFQAAFFRAGHAHAGVITLLSLIGQMLVDAAALSPALQWLARLGIPLSGIMLSAGFFTSMLPPTATTPGPAVALIYVGAALLVLSVVTLGVGLLRSGARTR
jgi:hypothetical protein